MLISSLDNAIQVSSPVATPYQNKNLDTYWMLQAPARYARRTQYVIICVNIPIAKFQRSPDLEESFGGPNPNLAIARFMSRPKLFRSDVLAFYDLSTVLCHTALHHCRLLCIAQRHKSWLGGILCFMSVAG